MRISRYTFQRQLERRDECRTPMQWSDEQNAGFTNADATPWLPLNPNYRAVNVAAQREESKSLLNTYRRLLTLRRAHSALKVGRLTLVDGEHNRNDILIYQRLSADETLTIYINFSQQPQVVPVDTNNDTILFTTQPTNQLTPQGLLQPLSGMIVK